MTAPEWYFTRNGEESGPVTNAELKRLADRGELDPRDLVRRKGWARSLPARTVKGLFAASPVPASSGASEKQPSAETTPIASPTSEGKRFARRPSVDTLWYAGTVGFALLLIAWLAVYPMIAQWQNKQKQIQDFKMQEAQKKAGPRR
jgi:hypothetical protein